MAYQGFITRIKQVEKHSNAHSLQIGRCFGNQVIVGMDTANNELGVYFPTDGQLSEKYCEDNNLVRKKDPVTGENIGGYLDPSKRHIRTLKLRGEESDGLFMPLVSLSSFIDIAELKEGDPITVLNGLEVCTKYVPRQNPSKMGGISNKTKKEKKVLFPAFTEHIDTKQLAYNVNQLQKGDICYLTLKMHGCFTSEARIRKWGESKSVPLKHIKKGDIVVGMNENGEYVPSRVLNIFNNGKSKNWMKLQVTRKGYCGKQVSKIICTTNHKFWVDGEYKEAESLHVGDTINSLKETNEVGGYVEIPQTITSITRLPNNYTRYDLKTETHNYVVSDLLVHNSSGRTGLMLQHKKLKAPLLQRLFTSTKTITEKTWEYVSGTRRVVLDSNHNGDGYYKDTSFREDCHNQFEGKLRKGETVYYEIVGYTDKNSPIMGRVDNKKTKDKEFIKQYGDTTTYSYGCEVGEWDIYIYRITITNEDGDQIDYPWDLVRSRADQMGLKTVPEFERFIYTTEANMWKRVNKYLDGADPIGKTHIREGVVLRIEGKEKFKALKHKSIIFKILEGIIKDAGVIDEEEAQDLLGGE